MSNRSKNKTKKQGEKLNDVTYNKITSQHEVMYNSWRRLTPEMCFLGLMWRREEVRLYELGEPAFHKVGGELEAQNMVLPV